MGLDWVAAGGISSLELEGVVPPCRILWIWKWFWLNTFLAGAKRQALQVTSSQEEEEAAAEEGVVTQYKIDHNSLNFWARSPKFCMEGKGEKKQKTIAPAFST